MRILNFPAEVTQTEGVNETTKLTAEISSKNAGLELGEILDCKSTM